MSNSLKSSNLQSILTKIQQREGLSKGFNQLNLLFQTIHQYLSLYHNLKVQANLQKSLQEIQYQRLQNVQRINKAIDIIMDDCRLQEECKMDCLEQSLRIIKNINGVSCKIVKGNSRKDNQNEKMKIIQQSQLRIIQKIAEFILTYTIPNQLTVKKNNQISTLIIKQLFHLNQSNTQQQKPKGKMKKKEPNLINSSIEYCLLSGKKISLPWLLIFRILQGKVMSSENIPSQKNKKTKQIGTISDQIQTKLTKYIRQILIELTNFNSHQNLISNLLKCLVENIKEMELPIIPIFINLLFYEMVDQFKSNYPTMKKNVELSNIISKNIYSLENLNTFCLLIKNVANQMVEFYMEREIEMTSAICSYCGIEKESNQRQKLIYQKVGIKINHNENLIIKICKNCCKILGFEPEDEINMNAFAPLIFSRFWNIWNEKSNINEIKQCLQKLLIYHIEPSKKKSNKTEIQISEAIAMNNIDERASNGLVEAAYRAYLFNHSKLSIKNIINQTINIFNIYMNNFDIKIRQKTLKIINQTHIIEFLFNQNKKIPSIYHQQLARLQNKTLTVIQLKCKDKDLNVRLVALEVISQIYSQIEIQSNVRQQFYKTIYREIAFTNNTQFMAKSIDLIERSIISKTNKSKNIEKYSVCEYIQLIFQTFIFSIQCIRNLSDSDQTVNLKQKIGKLINKLFKTLYQICYDDYNQFETGVILDQFNRFLSKTNQSSIVNLKDIYDRITIRLMKQITIDKISMKNLPFLTVDAIEYIVKHSQQYQGQVYIRVKNNLMNLIHIVFEDISQVRTIFSKQRQERVSIRCMFTIKQLQNYLSSNHFLEILVHHENKSIEISSDSQSQISSLKLIVLNQILSIANYGTIISQNMDLAKKLKKFMKNGNKNFKNTLQLNISQSLQKSLYKLAESILGQVKLEISVIVHTKSVLLTNILLSLNMNDKVIQHISIYKKYLQFFHKNLLAHIAKFDQTKQSAILVNITKEYITLSRILIILTSLIITMEKYLQFKSNIINLISIHSEDKKQYKEQLWQKLVHREQKVSDNFYSVYNLIVSILEINFDQGRNNQCIQRYVKQIMSLLNYYWQINPEIILSSNNLLKQISTNPQIHQIKNLYKLFLSLLPCSDLRILSIINSNFNETFHKIFLRNFHKNDEEFMEYSYRILEQVLKCGMTGLYEFNRYIYCGLLHNSSVINDVSAEIIKEVYAKEASQKLLFANFSETMKFIFNFYFQSQNKSIKEIIFSQRQKLSFKIITNMTKLDGKCFLVKQKRQIRMKSTFIKKMSETILKNPKILLQTPQYLIFLLKLIKCQECFDYCELYEITFTINKLVNQNYTIIEDIREELDDLDEMTAENTQRSLNICAAYRQLLSCLNYLSCYQQVQQQLKNYNKLFQNSNNPYITLKQDAQLSNLSFNYPPNTIFVKIFEDIDLLFDIAIGAVQRMEERKVYSQNQTIECSESSWSGTLSTKPKGKKGKKKSAGNKKSTKNIKHISHSAQKAKPYFSQYISRQPSFKRRSKRLGLSQESSY